MHHSRKIVFPLLLVLLIVVSIFISIIPDIYHLSIAPKDSVFPLVHNAPEDYFYYLSLMRQGLDGHVKVTSRMTPEIFPKMPVQTLFSLMGLSARFTGLSLEVTYFIARIVLGIAMILTAFLLIRKIFPGKKYQLIALFFICFSTGFWSVHNQNGTTQIIQYLTYWTRFDPILRTTYLPHHVLSAIFGVLSLYFVSLGLKKRSFQLTCLASLFGFLSGYVYFAAIMNILGGIGCAISIIVLQYVLCHPERSRGIFQPRKILPFILRHCLEFGRNNYFGSFFIFFTASFVSLLYLLSVSKSVFPWSNYNNIQNEFTFFIPWIDYLKALGPTGLLALAGLPILLSSSNILSYFLLGWSIFPMIGIFFISRFFHQYGNVYFLEATSYIPLGILAVFGIQLIEKLIRTTKFTVLLILFLFLYFIPPLYNSIDIEQKRLSPNRYNIYLPQDVINGMTWLNQHSKEESIVLSGGYFGVIIPAFTHNRVVNGHAKNTYKPAEKTSDMLEFFSGKDATRSAKTLQKYHVSYVFYSLDTDPPPKEFVDNLHLTNVFESSRVHIFKTNL